MTAYVRRAGAPIGAFSAKIITLVCFTAEQARGESRPMRERLSRRGRSQVKYRIECQDAATERARASRLRIAARKLGARWYVDPDIVVDKNGIPRRPKAADMKPPPEVTFADLAEYRACGPRGAS
jgi:hypothetical protein